MIVLGVSDGPNGVVTLVAGDQILGMEEQASHDGMYGSSKFPWAAIEAVLQSANLRGSEVDRVAVSGRFSPPLWLRRFPEIRRWIRPHPRSKVFTAASAYQNLVGWSGVGTYQEDRAAAWLERRLAVRGFRKHTVRLIHTHHALATAAYVCQEASKREIFVVHPRGDGPALSRYDATDILVQERMALSNCRILHTWLERAMSCCGFDPWTESEQFWYEALAGSPDSQLVTLLARGIRGGGKRWREQLADASLRFSCASVVVALADFIAESIHRAEPRSENPLLVGALTSHPLMRGLLLERIPQATFPSHTSKAGLAIGAAANLAGLGPRPSGVAAIQTVHNTARIERAMVAHRVKPKRVKRPVLAAAKVLAKGEPVAIFAGSARQVVMRADGEGGLNRLRKQLGQSAQSRWELCFSGAYTGSSDATVAQRRAHLNSSGARHTPDLQWVCARTPTIASAPNLHALIQAATKIDGCEQYICIPLSTGATPAVASASGALKMSLSAGLSGILMGPYWVPLDGT